MGWTSVYLNTNKKNVFIVGTGEVAQRRAKRFLENDSNVILLGKSIPQDLISMGAILEKDKSKKNLKKLVDSSDIVVIASGNPEINEFVSSISDEKLLNRADIPEKGNLIVPTSFYIGDTQISIFTNGKSPLMARELRKKIQETITEEDILHIELQDYARKILKENIDDQKERRDYLYKILENKDINYLLHERKLEKAKEYVNKILNIPMEDKF